MEGTKNHITLTVSSAIGPSLAKWLENNKIKYFEDVLPERKDGWHDVSFTGVAVRWSAHGMLQLYAPDPDPVLEPVSKTWFVINPHHYAGYSETKP
jgi:hypothetical protein